MPGPRTFGCLALDYQNQDCRAGTKISGSRSGHLNVLAPAPEQFGMKNQKKHCIICIACLPYKLSQWNRNTNFRLHLKKFLAPAPASAIQNCLGSGSAALIKTLLYWFFMFFGCSPHIKIGELFD